MRHYFLFFFALLWSGSIFAQQPSRSELEQRRASLLKEISATQRQLASTTQDRKVTVGQLNALNRKLAARQNLITNINAELGNIGTDINSLNTEIKSLNNNLGILKRNYAQSVRYAYKHKTSQSLILFLFSANSFNDALHRMQYLKRYRDYRKNQAERIRQTQVVINQKIGILSSTKREKTQLLQTEESQKTQIEQERIETSNMVTQLKGREGELRDQIKQNQIIANRIQAAIKAEIQKEIELARQKAAAEAKRQRELAEAKQRADAEAKRKADAEALAKKKADEAARERAASSNGGVYKAGNQNIGLNTGSNPPATQKTEPSKPVASNTTSASTSQGNTTIDNSNSFRLSLTPEVQALSNSFEANRGRLPWPVSSGYISGSYGRHPHPVYSEVTIDNNGIDITTGNNAPVRAVFEGTVIKIANIGGYVVMISHGEYFTVYSNLASVSVSVGSKVNTKQVIGTAGKNSDGESMINFQIWQVNKNNTSSTVNPTGWIAR